MNIKKLTFLVLSILLSCVSISYSADKSSGLPVPRFVSIKSNETNVRTGPSTRYPIAWVYKKSGMPVEIIEEFDMWRKIRDVEGTTGWIKKNMLEGKRNAIVKSKDHVIVRIDHEKDAKPLFKVAPSVIVKIVECEKNWCQIKANDDHKGWIEKSSLWGIYADEIIE